MFITHNLGCNVHSAMQWLNTKDFAHLLFQIVPVMGGSTILVFKCTSRDVQEGLKQALSGI